MQEGAGTTAYNGAPDALGSEEVTNGDFSNGSSNWILGGSGSNAATIQNGIATITSVNGNSFIQQSNILVTGKKYKIEYTITASSASSVLKLISSFGLASIPTTVGTHTLIANAASNTLYVERKTQPSSASIDNISVKEIANNGTISGATYVNGIGAPVAQTAVIDWNKHTLDGTNEVLIPQGLTSGRDLLGNLFTNVRKQGALNLDGSSFAEVHDNASLDIGDLSLEAWVKFEKNGDYQVFFAKDDSGSDRSYELFLNGNESQFGSNIFGGGYLFNTQTINDNQWYHVVATFTDSTNAFVAYVNGAQNKSATISASQNDTDAPLIIGAWYNKSQFMTHGQIAQPRIYNRALTAEEVQRNYDAGKNIYS